MKLEEIDQMPAGRAMDALIRRTVFQSKFVLLRSKQWGTYAIMWRHEWDKLSEPTKGMDDVIHWEDWKDQPVSAFMGEGPFEGWSQDNGRALDVLDEVGCWDVWQIWTSSEGTHAQLIERRILIPGQPIIEAQVTSKESSNAHFALAICRAALQLHMLDKGLTDV